MRKNFLTMVGGGSRVGQMAPWLKALTTLAEDQGLGPSTHMVNHNHP